MGLGFKDAIEALATPRLPLCGRRPSCTCSARQQAPIPLARCALGIGLAQACAILPDQPSSGTIGAALMLGVREEPPLFLPHGAHPHRWRHVAHLERPHGRARPGRGRSLDGYIVGTVAAFVSGWVACTWMIRLVKRNTVQDLGPTGPRASSRSSLGKPNRHDDYPLCLLPFHGCLGLNGLCDCSPNPCLKTGVNWTRTRFVGRPDLTCSGHRCCGRG